MGFSSVPPMALERTSGTSADFLLDLIVKKWALKPGDQDLVVMVHQFQYEKEGRQYQTTSSFGVVGKDETHTAMAKTVGLPLGICARLILEGNIKQKGLVLPLEKGIYQPVLRELSQFGITFETTTHPL
jgi:saccharopine dehydrogenase-like NADP-dependent oxidoreductase